MGRRILAGWMIAVMLLLAACGGILPENPNAAEASGPNEVNHEQTVVGERQIPYRCASREEGESFMLSREAYFNTLNQNELNYKLQHKNASVEEYQDFAAEQVLEFTEEEMALIDSYFLRMENILAENGYSLPRVGEIVLIKTTMEEEKGAAGYTQGTQIYIQSSLLEEAVAGKPYALEFLSTFFWHELFHVLTRNDPGFRQDMYGIIHFTVQEEDFPLPPSVAEVHIGNPDVEHHNAYATFQINGEPIDCYVAYIATKPFERPGEYILNYGAVVLVPIDGTDVYYTREQAANFDEVFGKNTSYVIDPEECLADNFSFALAYGLSGPGGNGYPNPEIIEAILDYLSR